MSASWFSYDEEGKLLWELKYIQGLGYKGTTYSYNTLGQLVKKVYQPSVSAETFVHYYEYDPANLQLWKVYTNTTDNISTRKLQASYTYYLHGPLKRIELAEDLQGIDYTYTLQGQLKAINNSNASADPGGDGSVVKPDAFGMVLDYYPGDYTNTRGGIAAIKGVNTSGIVSGESYAGNIRALSWFSKKPASVLSGNPSAEAPSAYMYAYDDKYQLKEGTWGTGLNFGTSPASVTASAMNRESVQHPTNSSLPGYDAHGNILYLQRTNGSGVLTDRFQYNYTSATNRLSSVVNDAGGSPQTYASYSYDLLGQLTGEANTSSGVDKSKYLSYDVTGKVTGVYRDAAKSQKVVEYVYDEWGSRILKKSYNSSYQLVQQTYYLAGVIYTQPVSGGVPGSVTVQEYELEGKDGRIGVYYRPSNIYAYQLSDHLGNVRAVVAKSGSSLEVRMYTDYYPYGMVISQGGTNDYRYEYQGQYAEKDKETDWNAFELRMYDSRIARWLSTDPAGEFWSPYVGMGNDPVNLSDPTGGETGGPGPKYQMLPEVIVTPGGGFLALSSLLNSLHEGFRYASSFAAGVGNAIASNNLLGAGRGNPSSFGKYATAAMLGQKTGDVLSLIQGFAETNLGAGTIGSGALVSATGVGIPAGAGAVGAGVVAIAHGSSVIVTATGNLLRMEDAHGDVHSGSGGEDLSRSIEKVNSDYLKKNGIDAHALKREFMGSGDNSIYDIYKDKKTGELIIYKRGGKGEGVRTGEYIK